MKNQNRKSDVEKRLRRFAIFSFKKSKGDDLLYKNLCWVFCSLRFSLISRALKWLYRRHEFVSQAASALWLFHGQCCMPFKRENFALSKHMLVSFVHADICQFSQKIEKWPLSTAPYRSSNFSRTVICYLKENVPFYQNKCFSFRSA